jgi:hypothetical protein
MRTDSCVVNPDQDLEGFVLKMNQDASESHLRATITVIDGDHRVVGFISHPEDVAGITIVWS